MKASGQKASFKNITSENITGIEYADDWRPMDRQPALPDLGRYCRAKRGSVFPTLLLLGEGGGLVAYKDSDWLDYRSRDGSGNCFSNNINTLSPGTGGRMWVGSSKGAFVVSGCVESPAIAVSLAINWACPNKAKE